MQFTGSSDDVLTRFLNDTMYGTMIGLGQTLETFDELGQISRILGLHGNTHERRDRDFMT
jgi:hypothetical protein